MKAKVKTYKEATMWLENRAKRYDTIKEIVMCMLHTSRTWTDDDIYRLFLVDDKELEEILEYFMEVRNEVVKYFSEEIQNKFSNRESRITKKNLNES